MIFLQECEMGNYETILNKLQKNKNLVHCSDEEGKTPLHIATINGHYEIVEYLIQNGADCNAQDKYGWTPLHNAACSREEKLIHFLLKQKNIKSNFF